MAQSGGPNYTAGTTSNTAQANKIGISEFPRGNFFHFWCGFENSGKNTYKPRMQGMLRRRPRKISAL
tara:strand:- start:1357 stop:1557 length:201 start_codon:yes stop_codon:yes gene_type:complete